MVDVTENARENDIRIYGRTKDGASVAIHVSHFTHYFYCSPTQWDRCKTYGNTREVASVEEVQMQSILYATSVPEPLIKINVRHANLLRRLKDDLRLTETYESSVSYALRFMVDTGIQGASWIRVPDYSTTATQIEPLAQRDDLAPLLLLSFDIECAGRRGIFPTPDVDPVIQIASVVFDVSMNIHRKVVYTLHSCDPLEDTQAELVTFENEADLLLAWSTLVQQVDPDFLVGYNILGFDLPYLLDRAQTLKVGVGFAQLSRESGYVCEVKRGMFQSRQKGAREQTKIVIPGRVVLDVLDVIRESTKLRSYTLNTVCAHFLGEQKEDVHHSQITPLFQGSAKDRKRLAQYCLKDALLPMSLVKALLIIPNYVEMSRVTGVPISYLLTRGQQIKVFTMILSRARPKGFVVPDKKDDNLKRGFDDIDAPADDVAYEGATVIEPKCGFYDHPIATLDFASLYPSIMMAHNLCYTTFIRPQDAHLFAKEDVTVCPSEHMFLKSHRRRGLLPDILDELLKARKRAKDELKKATDPMVKAVMEGRQLALKVSANSVYGFTGASTGNIPLTEIASSVTSHGRTMIELVKSTIEATFAHSVVVYGDTDSVMIKFAGVVTLHVSNITRYLYKQKTVSMTEATSVKTAMEQAKVAAELVTKLFPPPISMVFEKVLYTPP